MADFNDDAKDDYHALSRWAFAALLLGLLSICAMVHTIFWAIPLAGLLAGIAAIRQTRDPALAGRSLAVIGLCCTVFFAGCAQARTLMRRKFIYDQARIHAVKWMQLVSDGRLYRAHQLLMPPLRRAPPDQSLTEYYSNDENAKNEADNYFSEYPLNDLVSHGKSGSITFVRNLGHRRDKLEDTVEQLYHLRYEKDGAQVVRELRTRLMRRYDYKKKQCHWEFLGLIVADKD